MLSVATPLLSVPVPIDAAPSKNVTSPVGLPAPGAIAATVAVSVTLWPKADGVILEAMAVLVDDGLTT